MEQVTDLTELQSLREFFHSGKTRSYEFRRDQLRRLKAAIKKHESDVIQALHEDFRKPPFETFSTEVGFIYEEINVALRDLKGWMRPKKVNTPLVLFPSSSKIHHEPYGVTLIIAPWNYPFQLVMGPLIAAISAGNTALVHPSEYTPATGMIIEKIIGEAFPPDQVQVLLGHGAKVIPAALDHFRFDHIFFTGSTEVGRIIARSAAENLIPYILEMGGKSPAIVDSSANLKVTARRLAWGKWINAGQTCVAPDYLLVEEPMKDPLLRSLKEVLVEFYGDTPHQSEDLARIINRKHFDRLVELLDGTTILAGGQTNSEDLYFAPTIVEVPNMDHPLMKEEIFGPILPILSFSDFEEVAKIIKKNPDPLSLYVFSNRKELQDRVVREIPFGGGAINNTLVHVANPQLPFGGLKNSGLGNYHGEFGFKAFSNSKSIVETGTWFDLSVKYPPYGKWGNRIMRFFFK